MSGSIETICQQLGAAVELTMNPAIPMEQRHQVGFNVIDDVGSNFYNLRHLIIWRSSRRNLLTDRSADSTWWQPTPVPW